MKGLKRKEEEAVTLLLMLLTPVMIPSFQNPHSKRIKKLGGKLEHNANNVQS